MIAKITLRFFKAALLLCLMGCACGTLGWLVFHRIPAIAEYNAGKQQWLKSAISNYSFTLHRAGLTMFYPLNRIFPIAEGTRIVVRDGKVIEADNSACKDCDLRDYQQFNIDSLLDAAADCALEVFCRVTYDSKYGYPTLLFGGIMDGVGTSIQDFQVVPQT
jgi:hypothetical protein